MEYVELPVKPFRRIPLESIPGFTIAPGMKPFSPLATRELFGKNYFVVPMMGYNDEFFQGSVDYVADVAARWARAVIRVPDYSGCRTPALRINKMWDLVRLKSDIWGFQSEYRFYLFVMPMVPPFEPDGTNLPTLEQIMSTSDAMQQNVDPVATYIDVPLDPASLDHLVVRTGPLITEIARSRVEALVRQFAPNAAVVTSALEHTIRYPKRDT